MDKEKKVYSLNTVLVYAKLSLFALEELIIVVLF